MINLNLMDDQLKNYAISTIKEMLGKNEIYLMNICLEMCLSDIFIKYAQVALHLCDF